MLAQRRRRWPNVKTTLFQCIVFAGISLPSKRQHLYNIYTTSAARYDVGPTLYKCHTNASCLLGKSLS